MIAADFDGDGQVSVMDATTIRMKLAKIKTIVKQKWCLEKVNYLCDDANMDGDLEVGEYSETEVDEQGKPIALPGLDYIFVQDYLAKKVTMNNLQLFLADIDKNGIVDLIDTILINQFAQNKYF